MRCSHHDMNGCVQYSRTWGTYTARKNGTTTKKRIARPTDRCLAEEKKTLVTEYVLRGRTLIAPSGNRTRVTSMATRYYTTKPTALKSSIECNCGGQLWVLDQKGTGRHSGSADTRAQVQKEMIGPRRYEVVKLRVFRPIARALWCKSQELSALCQARTGDLWIMRPTLYQLSQESYRIDVMDCSNSISMLVLI